MCAFKKELLLLLYCWHIYNAYILKIKVIVGQIRQILTHVFRCSAPSSPRIATLTPSQKISKERTTVLLV